MLKASAVDERMRRGPEAEPRLEMPVAQVVAPLPAGAREVGDLVVLVAGGDQALVHRQIAPALGLLARKEARPLAAQKVHLRALVDLEQIEAQVVGRERDRAARASAGSPPRSAPGSPA